MSAHSVRSSFVGVVGSLVSVLLLAACAATTPPSTVAGINGVISGHVRMMACPGAALDDGSCPVRPMPGVTVRAQPADGSAVLSVKTDAAGAYWIAVPPGSYLVHPEAELRRSMAAGRQVTVATGQTVTADFTLRPGGWCTSGGSSGKAQPECMPE